MKRVADKVIVLTGAARGLGQSHARLLVEEGAMVVLADILDEQGEALAEELGDAARYVRLDVTDPGDWKKAVDVATTEFGRLDVLINNAGVAKRAPIEEHSVEDWNWVIDVNLTGTFLGIQAVIPTLKAAGGGSIINISSINGLQAAAKLPAYVASKFGVTGLTKAAAIDLAPYGIRVNSVHPGVIATEMTLWRPRDQSHTPLGRLGEPIEISRLVLFLASDEASFSTGSEFVADGGEITGSATKPDA